MSFSGGDELSGRLLVDVRSSEGEGQQLEVDFSFTPDTHTFSVLEDLAEALRDINVTTVVPLNRAALAIDASPLTVHTAEGSMTQRPSSEQCIITGRTRFSDVGKVVDFYKQPRDDAAHVMTFRVVEAELPPTESHEPYVSSSSGGAGPDSPLLCDSSGRKATTADASSHSASSPPIMPTSTLPTTSHTVHVDPLHSTHSEEIEACVLEKIEATEADSVKFETATAELQRFYAEAAAWHVHSRRKLSEEIEQLEVKVDMRRHFVSDQVALEHHLQTLKDEITELRVQQSRLLRLIKEEDDASGGALQTSNAATTPVVTCSPAAADNSMKKVRGTVMTSGAKQPPLSVSHNKTSGIQVVSTRATSPLPRLPHRDPSERSTSTRSFRLPSLPQHATEELPMTQQQGRNTTTPSGIGDKEQGQFSTQFMMGGETHASTASSFVEDEDEVELRHVAAELNVHMSSGRVDSRTRARLLQQVRGLRMRIETKAAGTMPGPYYRGELGGRRIPLQAPATSHNLK